MIKVGQVYDTKNCGKCRVIEYVNAGEVLVRFMKTKTEVWCSATNLRNGTVKDRFLPTVVGVGFTGSGSYLARRNGTNTKEYQTWRDMLRRCYDPRKQDKQPTYKGVTVCKEWHNFQNFAAWYNKQPHAHLEDYALDKDLLVNGNKVYSPKTCALVPRSINALLIGRDAARGKWPIGVHFVRGKFAAGLCKGRSKTLHLGTFDTPQEAHEAYCKAKTKMVRSMAKEYKNVLDRRIYKFLRSYTEVRVYC